MKKEEKLKEKYQQLKDKYAKEFSELMIQRLNLEVNEFTGCLFCPDIIQRNAPMEFIENGYKYVPFSHAELAENNSDMYKLFDPYNDIALCNTCVMWYLHYIQEIDVNNRVDMISISNSKMNELGHGTINFNDRTMEDMSTNDWEFEYLINNNKEISGNNYYRDSIKYLDLIFMMDEAAPPEFIALKGLDLPSFEAFSLGA